MDLVKSFKDNCGFGLLASIKNVPSHKNLIDATTALERMMHRGAIASDGKSGDGSGLLLSIPHKFMRKVASQNGVSLPKQYGICTVFVDDTSKLDIMQEFCQNNDLNVVFKREVPVNTDALGVQALETLPKIVQVFVTANSIMASKRFDALLFLTRKELENHFVDDSNFYIPTFSSKVTSYKGLVMPTYIKDFYLDLQDKDFEISFCLFHQRFSTNTLPQWRLAQPFRSIAHNGEINSVEANRFNVEIKEESIKSKIFKKDELKRLLPILQKNGSDSASLDNFFEFLITNGMDFFKAARTVVPAPWQNAPYMDSKLRSFYEYNSAISEAWDGPAAVSLTDGRYIGCVLDRNGLRPSKYIVTKDDTLIISSEFGVVDIDEENIVERGRLQSGEMIGLDLKYGQVLKNNDINKFLKKSQPYSEWLNDHMIYLQEYVDNTFVDLADYRIKNLSKKQKAFNISLETIEQIIEPMSIEGKEPVGSMGDDTPIAAFSNQQRTFTDFFKQKFAQVTNPPIDPYRETIAMSLNTGFGEIKNVLKECKENTTRLKTVSPILMKEKHDVLLSFGDKKSPRYNQEFKNRTFSTTFKENLEESLETLSKKVIDKVKNSGVRIVVLDDRKIAKDDKVMPMAMVVGKLNQDLLKHKLRSLVSFVAVTGEVFDPHSASVLLAFGVAAIYPYLAYATIVDMNKTKDLTKNQLSDRLKNFQKALNAGLLKIMSKMGICTIASYRNSALHDVIGLSSKIHNDCFSASNLLCEGLCYSDIEQRVAKYHDEAFTDKVEMFPINIGGFYKHLENNEHHDYAPKVIYSMHKASITANKDDYNEFRDLVNNRDKKFIRDFFEFKSDKDEISVDDVEPLSEIFKRFATAAMSCGSISPEAHECMAMAMNKLGGASNSGEGGEDPKRFDNHKNSKIKQVASGRFGVTPGYLASAEEIQIKVAQGAKPGEGGQLPGHKVTPLIASLRFTIPGVTLISPPPHHDIYSIEDLAQLIFDMKQINPKAKVTVKLVSTSGVGTIAAGVAKAYADKIIISGGDGGTGAAPLSSIKFAGNPWEIGLSEAHNALKVNNLRQLVHVQTDGGLKTGLDVVKAAMLGAESFAFGTGALVILGCKILRVCHLNRCTVGVATQDERLREHFVGTVDRLVNYFTLLAEDIREILAKLGYSSIEQIVGRSDLLKVIDDEFAQKFDFSNVLMRLDGIDTCQAECNEPFDKNEFEKELLSEVYDVITKPNMSISLDKEIKNIHRSFGTRISGEIAKYYGDKGLSDNSININLTGVAGQSLGAFLIKGISIKLDGYANDYVAKGLSGGKIIITPKLQGSSYSAIGNTCLYGATSGKLFVSGSAGERFAVRNSGAIAVVEGTGDHPCEYMTGGVVVILGETGINFGAGMTGGVAFVFDENKNFADKLNRELIEIIRIDTDDNDRERHYLKKLLRQYVSDTKSQKAQYILDNFRDQLRNFWMVKPKDMNRVPLSQEEGD
jgi:glutamate synthase (NADPH/NADH) large chain